MRRLLAWGNVTLVVSLVTSQEIVPRRANPAFRRFAETFAVAAATEGSPAGLNMKDLQHPLQGVVAVVTG